jgi:carbonic anhydrase
VFLFGKGKDMAHKCKAAVVTCIDFRFQDDIRVFIEERGMGGNVDLISVPGGVKDKELVLGFLELSKKLHDISEVYLVNHQECGAYGPEVAENIAKELGVHRSDLLVVKQLVEEKVSGVEVKTYFLTLDKEFKEV